MEYAVKYLFAEQNDKKYYKSIICVQKRSRNVEQEKETVIQCLKRSDIYEYYRQ